MQDRRIFSVLTASSKPRRSVAALLGSGNAFPVFPTTLWFTAEVPWTCKLLVSQACSSSSQINQTGFICLLCCVVLCRGAKLFSRLLVVCCILCCRERRVLLTGSDLKLYLLLELHFRRLSKKSVRECCSLFSSVYNNYKVRDVSWRLVMRERAERLFQRMWFLVAR